ncbi:MAG: TetR/AcrR family transcriptional regulator [Lentisphaeria bacterium]|nr:TetR/AcrR family transcriptional regulator [Lentisphaeria bacterium]
MNKSALTRRRILAAAVQQIAGEDIYHRLQLERIAEKAGISEATIHYHFGRKDDFSKAVWQSIMEERKPFTLSNFYAQNKKMLSRENEQRQFIHMMIENYCAFFRTPKSEYLRRLIRLFFIENIGMGKIPREHVNQYFQSELSAFHHICRDICGTDNTFETALWFLFIMHPLSIAFTHMINPDRQTINVSREQYERSVMGYAEQQLLFRLGLLSPLEYPGRNDPAVSS